MSADPTDLLKELLEHVSDGKGKALVEAYLLKADARSMAEKALDLLSKAIDENHAA